MISNPMVADAFSTALFTRLSHRIFGRKHVDTQDPAGLRRNCRLTENEFVGKYQKTKWRLLLAI
ncbi:hypothetical protein NKI32_26335 [Mesorhizobium sp. M0761]|uniref:hypothetical protein n=1 Tax=Mesorhizobium sp. M0761 TaxID=2956994 RepID=UPI0033387672